MRSFSLVVILWANIVGGGFAPLIPRPRISATNLNAFRDKSSLGSTASDVIPFVGEAPTTTVDCESDADEQNFAIEDSLRVASPSNVQSRVLELPDQWTGRLLVLSAAAIYGTNFVAVKSLDDQIPFAAAAAIRFTLAAVTVGTAVAVLSTKKEKEEQYSDVGALLGGAEVGAWYWIGYICQAIGLQTAAASKSAFFNALAVIVVPLLDAAFRGKKLSGRGIFSCLLAVVGVAFLQLGGTSLFQFTDGDIFSMLQALFFGIGYWRLESVANRYQGQPGLLTVGQLVAVAVGSLGFWFTTSGLPDVSQLVSWLSNAFIAKTLIWTGLVSTALALYLETVALKAISATELTVLMTSISLWGSLFAWTWTGELLAQTGMVGGVMIVASCILWAVSPKSEKDAL